MVSHVANELKSIFHIISLWHMQLRKEIKASWVGTTNCTSLLWIWAPCCYALPVMINYFILFLCVHMILIIHHYLCQI
jgi:hypothetical protein